MPALRLFVALVPPEEVLEHLDSAVAELRREQPRLRWIPPERWHLTLAFLGAVEERLLPELTGRLDRAAARRPSMGLSVQGAGRFGRQVLWAGVGGEVALLQRLAAGVAAGARRCGIPVDERPYRPHLTVARAREPVDLHPLVDGLAPYAGPGWTARDVRLVRSPLGPVPSYSPLHTAALADPAPAAPSS